MTNVNKLLVQTVNKITKLIVSDKINTGDITVEYKFDDGDSKESYANAYIQTDVSSLTASELALLTNCSDKDNNLVVGISAVNGEVRINIAICEC